MEMMIFTIGHSTRTWDELLSVLHAHQIAALADVRSFPKSRHHPQFNRDDLAEHLPQNNIEYLWLGLELGGFRKKMLSDSPHTALRSPAFRNYADYMGMDDFRGGIGKLSQVAMTKRVAVMCAEQVWWRCHRSMISDYLSAVRGVEVVHLYDEKKTEPHRLNRVARLSGDQLVYDVTFQGSLL